MSKFAVGDRVEIINATDEWSGMICTLISWSDFYGKWETDIPYTGDKPFDHWWGDTNQFRKINDDDQASWDEIERITGWKPREVA